MYTFSGIDSSGKTTQIELLVEYCRANNIDVYKRWSKGRATPGVLWLKEVFRKDKGMQRAEMLEYREANWKNPKKKFALLVASILDLWWFWGIYYRILDRKHEVFICDRYIWDTYIDFKTEFPEYDVDRWLIWKIAAALAPKPKHSFMFFITAEESFRRDNAKGDPDRDELGRKKQKVEKYKKLMDQNKWDTIVSGMQTREEMFEIVKGKIFG